MATKTMSFSRSSNGYNAENGDYLDFDPDSTLSFGSTYICTDFYVEITGGITSATTSARTHEMKLQLKLGSNWRTVWSGEQYLPAKGTTGYTITFSGTIPSAYQSEAATNGISDIRLQQSGDYALRGANATGSLEVTYEENITYTNCGAPTLVTINGSSSDVTTIDDTVTLAWSGASGGTNNAIAGYYVDYSDSTDGSTWGDWDIYTDEIYTTSSSYSMSVNLPGVGTYRRFRIFTFGSAGEDYMSESKLSPVVYHSSALPVWYNGTQLTSITVVKNGVSTKITSLTVVKDGVSTKLF